MALSDLLYGFSIALTGENLLFCLIGVLLGQALGALPGVGTLAAASILLPVTLYLEPTTALIMLAGVYYGAEYGGSTASILLNLPGTPAHAVACLDGYPMARQGRAGVALFMTAVGSFVGGSIGIIILMILTPPLVLFARAIGPAEYCAVMVFGLLSAANIGAGSPAKSVAMVVIGLLFGTVGADINSGIARFDLGIEALYDGVPLVVLAMGLFGVSEIIRLGVSDVKEFAAQPVTLRSMIPTRDDVRRCILPILRGSAVGSVYGPLPGTGPTIATFLSYALEKRLSRSPERFGRGAIEGVTAPEAANNSAAQTAFVPTLGLGVPGSATMAIMLGALMMNGVQAGPMFIAEHPDIFWGVVASFWIGNVLLLLLNIPLIGIWVRLLNIPPRYLMPGVIVIICLGAYSTAFAAADVWMVMAFGIIGYVLRELEFETAPLLLGFILGPLLEENMRRALLLSRGDYGIFFSSTITVVCIVGSILVVAYSLYSGLRQRSAAAASDDRQLEEQTDLPKAN